jgi:pilus assembly protein FimV
LPHLDTPPSDTGSTSTEKPYMPSDSGLMEFDLGSISLDLDTPTAPAASTAPASTEAAPLDDPLATKLALAQEFNTIGDTDGARTLVEEVIAEASGELKARAQRMLAELG